MMVMVPGFFGHFPFRGGVPRRRPRRLEIWGRQIHDTMTALICDSFVQR
jgi:hypothetical protein